MENISQIVSKVKQAPWRVQRQWVGLILLALVGIALITGININVTAQAAIMGRQILRLKNGYFLDSEHFIPGIDLIKRDNAIIETELATLGATEKMQARAKALGFHPATNEEIIYIQVAGYVANPPINLATRAKTNQGNVLPSEYTETLFDWLTRQMAAGVKP